MGRPKGSKDKGKRVRRFCKKPEEVTPVVVAPPVEETKTEEPVPPLDPAQTETPVQ